MGKKLMEFYEKAQQMGSSKAKMRLAMITCISSVKAGEAPDSPENLKKFEDAMKEIEKEFK